MKNISLTMLVVIGNVWISGAANVYFRPDSGKTGGWEDATNWKDKDGAVTTISGNYANIDEGYCATISSEGPTYANQTHIIGGTESSSVLKIANGGTLSSGAKKIYLYGKQNPGVLVIEKGGVLTSCQLRIAAEKGTLSYGIVTNAGTYKVTADTYIANDISGSRGYYVLNGGANEFSNNKILVVGGVGVGEVLVNNGEFLWCGTKTSVTPVYVASQNGLSQIVVESGSSFAAPFLYLGDGNGRAGRGRLSLHGGTVRNALNNGTSGQLENFQLGTCPGEGADGVDPQSYGEICGWGGFVASSSDYQGVRGVRIRMGNGAIIADGNGVERSLDLRGSVSGISNVLLSGPRTNGLHAVNLGKLIFPAEDLGYYAKTTNVCIGCASGNASPDIVNAIRLSGSFRLSGKEMFACAELLDPNRSDAHSATLPNGNILGVWKVYANRVQYAEPEDDNMVECSDVRLQFRYDQTKVRSADDLLVLYRYERSTSKWCKVARGKQSDDYVFDSGVMPKFDDEQVEADSNIGLFALVSTPKPGLLIVVQ